MSKFWIVLAVSIGCVSTGVAQSKKAVSSAKPTGIPAKITPVKGAIKLPPGRTVTPTVKKTEVYPDSVKFKSNFSALYTEIRPPMTIRELTQQNFQRASRTFKMYGVDSGVAYEKVMKSIDPSMDEQILYKAYRKEFTADELASLTAFFKTPAGKKFLTFGPMLTSGANGQIYQYVNRTISGEVAPMMKKKVVEPPMSSPKRPAPMVSGGDSSKVHSNPQPAINTK